MVRLEADSLESDHRTGAVLSNMYALYVTTSTRAVPAHAADPRCRGPTFRDIVEMSLEELRQKVIFHNSIDVWISLCTEKNQNWTNSDDYKKFIAFLLENKLNMRSFTLCAHEAGNDEAEKTKLAESLAESKDDPNSAVYTIKLSDSVMELIRRFTYKV